MADSWGECAVLGGEMRGEDEVGREGEMGRLGGGEAEEEGAGEAVGRGWKGWRGGGEREGGVA